MLVQARSDLVHSRMTVRREVTPYRGDNERVKGGWRLVVLGPPHVSRLDCADRRINRIPHLLVRNLVTCRNRVVANKVDDQETRA
jgi:hypothetical protein